MEDAGVTINGVPSPYGYGLVRDNGDLGEAAGHGGWIAGARSESVRFKEADLGIVLLANHDDCAPYVLARSIARDLLGGGNEKREQGFNLPASTYRDEAGDDAFQIELHQDQPYLVMNMGGAPLLPVGDGSWQPQASIPAFALKREAGGTLSATRFGRTRRFIPIVPTATPIDRFAGRSFAAESGAFRGETRKAGAELHLTLSSPEGSQRVKLIAHGDDFFFAHPVSAEVHDQWRVCPWVLPWLFTVRITADRLIINSDRTKRLVLSELGQ